jgi:hypothetical protein
MQKEQKAMLVDKNMHIQVPAGKTTIIVPDQSHYSGFLAK